jgi:hypothetical protein
MLNALNAHQENFKIMEDVENVDHLHHCKTNSTMKISHHIFQHHRIIVEKFYTYSTVKTIVR